LYLSPFLFLAAPAIRAVVNVNRVRPAVIALGLADDRGKLAVDFGLGGVGGYDAHLLVEIKAARLAYAAILPAGPMILGVPLAERAGYGLCDCAAGRSIVVGRNAQ
jgi:hypothetical protein